MRKELVRRKGGEGWERGGKGDRRTCFLELKEPGGSVHTSTSFRGRRDVGVHVTVNAAGVDDGNVVEVAKSMR
jgi:hypothetical protein